jgi:carbon storage regulator
MLVLSRKLGEGIVIGDNILLTVVAIRGNQIRLGITAPREVGIRREELGWVTGPPSGRNGAAALRAQNVGVQRTTSSAD